MKYKYFITFLVSFYFSILLGQNNAINLVGNNNSFYFSGPDGTTYNYSLNLANFTIEYDFYLNNLGSENARFISGLPYNNTFARPIDFYINSSGNSILRLGNGTNIETIPNTPSFTTGQWYHVAFVVENTATKNIKMYVNGLPVVDYNFSYTLATNANLYIGFGASSFTADFKLDNLRIWSSSRTSTEIANNYNTCLTNSEPNLEYHFNFDETNGTRFKNKVTGITCKYGIGGNRSFSTGTGCSISLPQTPITVTGNYAGIYYYVDDLNGKPHYKTDDLDCNCILAESPCDRDRDSIYEIFWDNTQWVLAPADCVWLFTNCSSSYFDSSNNIGTNAATTNFVPCTGWSFVDTNASSIFSSNDCTALSTTNLEFNKNVSVYPNPTKDYLNIETKETISIEILNLLGEIIISNPKLDGLNRIKLDNLSSGVYILKATNLKQETISFKIIKDK